MVAPTGNNSQKFSILLEFAVNEQLYDEIYEKTKGIADETKRAEETARLYGEAIKKTYPELYKQIQAEKAATEAAEKLKEATKKQNLELQLNIRNLRAQAREIVNQTRIIRDSADDWDRLFRPLAVGGALLTGGIVAFAKNYVDNAEQATETTRKWKAAQADLERSGDRIGEVLAREVLPLLEDVTRVTKQVAGVLEAHPEIARAALAGGLVALTAGTLGKLYTQGLRLYADIKLDKAMALQLTAAELQLQASNNQLKAAGLQSKSSILPAAGGGAGIGGGLAAGLTSPLGIVTLGAGALLAANAFDKQLIRLEETMAKAGKGGAQVASIFDLVFRTAFRLSSPLLDIVHNFSLLRGEIGELFGGGNQPQQSPMVKAVENFLGGSKETQDKIVDTFYQWQQDDARIVDNAMEERKQIVADGEKAIADITAGYISQRNTIASRSNAELTAIDNRHKEEEKQALIDYQNERNSIIKDGATRIQEIEADYQEQLRKLEKDSFERQSELIADRDALGLIKEQRRLQDARAEASRTVSETIQKEKQETAQRLNELASRYAQEKAQRLAQYEADKKEASLKRAQEMKEAAEQYAAQLKQQREANAQKLKEQAEAIQTERQRRIDQLLAQLKDLYSSLVAERTLRTDQYNLILQEAAQFMDQYRSTLSLGVTAASSLGTASGGVASTGGTNSNFPGLYHDFTGYANPGMYRFNQREYVLDQPATRAAERAIGGQITPQVMAQMFAMMGAARKSIQLVDNSKYDAGMSARVRRDIRNDVRQELEDLVRG